MGLGPFHLAVVLLAAVAVALACDTRAIPPVDAPAPTTRTAPPPDVRTAPASKLHRSSLPLVGPSAAHLELGVEAHVDLRVPKARENEAASAARVPSSFQVQERKAKCHRNRDQETEECNI